MTNAELIAALKDAEGYIIYVAPNCVASCETIKAIRAAADALEAAEQRIEELEAQIPKRGEWIAVKDWLQIPQEDSGTYRCSACGQVMKYPWNYCPNCGARMNGAEMKQCGSD